MDGEFGFWVEGDDHVQLWMGPPQPVDAEAFHSDGLELVADNRVNSWSKRINMRSNETYLLQSLHKEGGGGDWHRVSLTQYDTPVQERQATNGQVYAEVQRVELFATSAF